MLATYATWSLLAFEGWTGVVVVAVSCATSLAGLAAARPPGTWWAAGLALGAVALLTAIGAAPGEHEQLLGAASVVQIVLLVLAIGWVLRRIVMATSVSFEPILGALGVYALLGIMFASCYAAINRFAAEPFFEGLSDPASTEYVFFSFTTLTTTGYGNLVPASKAGEMVAGLEMLVGQIFLLTLVARLVALWQPGERIRSARKRRAQAGEGQTG